MPHWCLMTPVERMLSIAPRSEPVSVGLLVGLLLICGEGHWRIPWTPLPGWTWSFHILFAERTHLGIVMRLLAKQFHWDSYQFSFVWLFSIRIAYISMWSLLIYGISCHSVKSTYFFLFPMSINLRIKSLDRFNIWGIQIVGNLWKGCYFFQRATEPV